MKIKKTFLLLAAVWASGFYGCDYSDAPQAAPLSELVEARGAYQGMLVSTAGIVRHHPKPLHYWIEDDAINRVALVPTEKAEAFLGEPVRVVGWFHFDSARGRYIEIKSIKKEIF